LSLIPDRAATRPAGPDGGRLAPPEVLRRGEVLMPARSWRLPQPQRLGLTRLTPRADRREET
jgi:hypothetical protein